MSFNPTLMQNKKSANNRVPPAGSGTKHSDIVKRSHSGVAPIGIPKRTDLGVEDLIFESDKFTVKYLTIAPGASTGLVVNPKGDRFIQVNRGTLYLFINEKGVRVDKVLNQGGCFSAPKDLSHGFATSATEEVSILLVESKNYGKTLKVIEPGLRTTVQIPMLETSAVRNAREALINGKEPPVAVKRQGRPKSVVAATQTQLRDQSRKVKTEKATYDNPNSISSVGNVKPLGAAAFRDEE